MSSQGIEEQDVEVKAPEPTIRDDIAFSIKELLHKDETPEQKADRERDEQGRFAKAQKDTGAQAKRRETLALPSAPPSAGGVNGEAPQQGTPATPAVKAPDTWTAAAKAKFATLDPEIQAEISRRETEMHRQFTTQDQDRVTGKKVRELSQPYMHIIRAEGGQDETAAYSNFLNWAYVMRGNNPQAKIQALQQVCREYNVPLDAVAHQQQYQEDPYLQALQPLQQQVQTLAQRLEQQDQQRQYQEQAQLTGEIKSFAESPGHEHFHQVREIMGRMLEAGIASDLDDAYDKAVHAVPEIRSTLTNTVQAQRIAQSQAQTDAARRAAVSVTGSPGGARAASGNSNSERSLADELRANLRAATGRI